MAKDKPAAPAEPDPGDWEDFAGTHEDWIMLRIAHLEAALAASKPTEPMLPKRYLDTEIERMGKEHDAEVAGLEAELAAEKAAHTESKRTLINYTENLKREIAHAADDLAASKAREGEMSAAWAREQEAWREDMRQLSAAQAENARLRGLLERLHRWSGSCVLEPPCGGCAWCDARSALAATPIEKEDGDAGR